MPETTTKVWRVLLVDDDPLVSDSIRRMLEFEKCQVRCAESGSQALSLCEKHSFDVILVDFLMPGMKGDALAIQLKERYPRLPIIMITADADKLGALTQLSPSVDLLVGKPFRLDDLREAMNKVLFKS